MSPIDLAHAPEATNPAERTVFAQVFETLVDIDCNGRPRPALAKSWTFDDTKTRITVELRDSARFSNGAPVTAADVLASWRATAERSTTGGHLAGEIARGTTVVDEHSLIVSLPDTAWAVLARSALAVYQRQSASDWPIGSGPYRRVEASDNAAPDALLLAPPASSSDPYLRIRRVPSSDPRDAIDAGADVVFTNDPVAVGYAATHLNLAAVALPWTHTYSLAVPGVALAIVSTLLRSDSASVALRESLARDAVRAEARGARAPYWWDVRGGCAAMLDSTAATMSRIARSNRVVYRRDDNIARGLAERIVALDAHTVAAALTPDDFTRALRAGSDAAYVLDLPRVSLSACNDFDDLAASVPWLDRIGSEAMLVPLIDTRETAIVNRDRVSATFDWRGTLRFGSAGIPR